MENQVMVLPQEVVEMAKNVSAEKRNEVQNVLNKVFDGVAKMREQLDSITVVDENDKVNMKLSNTIRLGVRQVRLDSEKTFDAKRDEVQQQMSSFKTEDALWLKSKQVMQILTKEIEENARWKEETSQRFEAEKKELKIQERTLLIAKFNLEISRNEFESMSDEMFNSFVFGLEKQEQDRVDAELKEKERLEAIEKAEVLRLEAQRIENLKLKAEAEAREKAIELERLERAKLEEVRIAKDTKERAELNAKLKAEAEAKSKLEAELQAKKDAELNIEVIRLQKIESDKVDAIKAAKAPIKKQLNIWVDSFELPTSPIENETTLVITNKFNAFKKWAKIEIENLK